MWLWCVVPAKNDEAFDAEKSIDSYIIFYVLVLGFAREFVEERRISIIGILFVANMCTDSYM